MGRIIGIGGSIHDFAACLIDENDQVRAIEEERLSRIRYAIRSDRPCLTSVLYCLQAENLQSVDPECVVGNDLLDAVLDREHWPQLTLINHHLSHTYSGFFTSPFDEAAILVADGAGSLLFPGTLRHERETTTYAVGRKNQISFLGRVTGSSSGVKAKSSLPPLMANSMGDFYRAITEVIGFGYLEAGKTMGLSSYGDARFFDDVMSCIHLLPDGQFEITLAGDRGLVNALGRMHSGSNHEDPFVIDAAIAYAGQAALERLLVHALDYLWSQTKTPNLCLVGGVALNSLANGKIPSLTHFTNVHVFYAPGDSGTAIGAAIWKRVQGEERNTQKLRFFWSPYLGREYLEGESCAALGASCLVAKRPKNLHRDVAELFVRGRTVGWFQGGSEFGPRALGHRSILADPRRSSMRDHINRRIKGREWFRPLAPVVEASRAAEFFELPAPSPWMQFVCPVRKHARELLPAVTHVDGGARVQTLRAHDNPSLAHLLHEFEPLSGVPVLINTSLNVRGAPIAETPADAIDAFVSSELDALVIDEFLIVKTNTQRD